MTSDISRDEEVITREDLMALPEYSCTIPTGVVIGKRWRCASRFRRLDQENQEWFICIYVQDPHHEVKALIHRVWAVSEPGVPHKGELR